jgi:Rho GTPase-activating protein 1
MTWTLSAYQSLGRKHRKGIKKLFVVHSGTWTRIVLEVAGRVVSPKFARKIKYVGTLSELAEFVPLTQVRDALMRLIVDQYPSGGVCV